MLSSFDKVALESARQAQPQLPRACLFDRLQPGQTWDDCLHTAAALQCQAIVCQYAMWTEASHRQAQALGLRCLAYTVNTDAEVARLLALGLDGLITDRVDAYPASRAS